MTTAEDSIIRKVEALLERAGHAATPPGERETCLSMADKLMATAVGYEDDLFYAEMLWANVYMDFITKMFPKWEPWRSFDENVYIIKSSGYGWPHVCVEGLRNNGADQSGPLTQANSGSKLRTAFKREAKRRGEVVLPGRQQPAVPQLWRDSFAQSYQSTVESRLQTMKWQNREAAGNGSEIALVKDEDRIKAEFWRLFPQYDPEEHKRRWARMDAEEEARRARLTPEELEAEEKEREKEERRWARRKPAKEKQADMRGWNAGNKAGNSVKLSADKNVGNGRMGALE